MLTLANAATELKVFNVSFRDTYTIQFVFNFSRNRSKDMIEEVLFTRKQVR